MDYSPIIANKLALTTATMTADEIADELLKMLTKRRKNKMDRMRMESIDMTSKILRK